MAKTKSEEKAGTSVKSPKKRPNTSVSMESQRNYPFQFYEKNSNKKSLEGRFYPKLKTAISGTDHTVTTEDNKLVHRRLISQPIIFQEDSPRAKSQKRDGTMQSESKTLPIPDEISAGNRHMLRNVNGKYSKWSEVLEDILAGKIKLKNSEKKRKDERRKRYEESDSGSDSDFECHDTTEKEKYTPILTRPENEVTEEQQSTYQPPNQDEDINNNSGENSQTGNNSELTETETRKSKRTKKPPNRLGGVPYVKNFLG